jgi:predicted MFS family arabinose efflux permease
LLTQYIDWRAVFLINVPLAAITIALTLLYTRAGGHRGCRSLLAAGSKG